MKLPRARSLNQLFILGILLASAPLVIGMTWSFIYVPRFFDNSEKLVAQGIELGRETEKLDSQIAELERNARQFAVVGDQSVRELYEQRHEKLVATLDWLDRLVSGDETRMLVSELRSASESTRSTLRSDETDLNDRRIADDFASLRDLSSTLESRVSLEVRTQLESLRATTDAARRISYVVGGVALLLMAVLLAVSTAMVTRPIRQLDTHIRRLGRGAMDEPVRIAGPLDVSRLGERLDWLRRRLAEVDEAKDQFMREMSHQLKTPLASIREGTELLLEGSVEGQPEVKEEVLGILHQNSLELQRMLDNMLGFTAWRTNPRQLTFERFALRPIIESTAERHRIPLLSRHQTLIVECPPELDANMDRGKFRVIIDNLLSNAVKYAPAGGRVQVRVSTRDNDIVLEVIDDGPGVPASERESVFELFYRGRETGARLQGTGVGLALVRAYVEAHGGAISILPDNDSGGHFVATIPRR